MTKKLPFYLLAILLTCSIFSTSTGQNLVPNPSFETVVGTCNLDGISDWFRVPGHGGSADLMHGCAGPTGSFGMPDNVFGYQYARTGIGYLGFVTKFVSADWREYTEVQLISPLVAGTTYDVEAYVSLSDGSGQGTDGYQFYFSNAMLTTGVTSAPIPVTPQVANPACNNITDQLNWVRISGSFVAAGGEQYLTIGNFNNDAGTCFSTVPGWSWNYSYMDDVSVTAASVLSARDLKLSGIWNKEETPSLTWTTSSEDGTSHFIVQRSENHLNEFVDFTEVPAAGYSSFESSYHSSDKEANSASTNFYRIKLIDQNGAISYSNTIELTQSEHLAHTARLYPNPGSKNSNSTLELDFSESSTMNWEILDGLGRSVKRGSHSGITGINKVHIPTSNLEAGYYFVRYTHNKENFAKKLLIK